MGSYKIERSFLMNNNIYRRPDWGSHPTSLFFYLRVSLGGGKRQSVTYHTSHKGKLQIYAHLWAKPQIYVKHYKSMLHLSEICKFKIEFLIFEKCCKLSNLCSIMHEIIKSMCKLSDLMLNKSSYFLFSNW